MLHGLSTATELCYTSLEPHFTPRLPAQPLPVYPLGFRVPKVGIEGADFAHNDTKCFAQFKAPKSVYTLCIPMQGYQTTWIYL